MKLAGKNIAVIGFGLTGQSCVRFLQAKKAKVTAFDTRELLQVKSHVPVVLGDIPEQALLSFDAVIVSPGLSLDMPALVAARANNIEVIGDIELFARFVNCPVIAVTGSNGKSTVVDMLRRIFTETTRSVGIGGNIGTPALDLLDGNYELMVLELSSFQLETCQRLKPFVSVILNVSEDHLDRHGNLASYAAAKQRIYHQATIKIANANDALSQPQNSTADYLLGQVQTQGIGLDSDAAAITLNGEVFLTSQELQVAGLHNLFNAQAAILIASLCDLDDTTIKHSLKQYIGLPHRSQKIRTFKGVTWIDDSKATNVGATIAGIEGIKATIDGDIILLAGGDSKQADLSPLQTSLNEQVKHLIVFGKDAHLIAAMKTPLAHVSSMDEAVVQAAQHAKNGDAVLLSPACASLDMFNNFSHRGRCFQEAVGRLQ